MRTEGNKLGEGVEGIKIGKGEVKEKKRKWGREEYSIGLNHCLLHSETSHQE